MVNTGTDEGGRKTPRGLIGAATLLLLLIVLTALVGQVGVGLAMAGLAVLGVGLVAAIRGEARWASILTRRIGLGVAGAGFAALVLGALVSPSPATSTASQSSTADAVGATTSASTAAPRTRAVVAAPVTPAVVVPTVAPRPVPQLAMTCPAGGSVASPVFGQQITATAPFKVTIDYGDGDHYANDDQHLAAIFSHTYRQAGSFVVTAALTDATGQTANSSCTYSWTKPVVVTGGSSHGSTSGGGSSSGTGSSGDTYTNVDGNQVSGPVSAPVAPAGATAQCKDGDWSFSQHRSGTCSGHGGVARWLG